MVNGSNVGAAVDSRSLPILPEALEYAAMGLIPAGAYKNREFRAGMVRTAATVERAVEDLLYDPQTSGGLLIAVDEGEAHPLLDDLLGNGVTDAVIIGRVQSEPHHTIVVE
jgi:selenide,water dikinase